MTDRPKEWAPGEIPAPTVLDFSGSEFGALQVTLPGISFAQFTEARRLVEAGDLGAPLVRLVYEAFSEEVAPLDRWGLADDVALGQRLHGADGRWFE